MNSLNGLYAITDARLIPDAQFATRIELALKGGARIIQYRDKSNDHIKRTLQATILKQLCDQYQALCIINDDIDLALEIKAHGLHIGRDDGELSVIRQRLGEDKIIGVSCYNQLALAQVAEQQGADYVAFGSFFSSPTKPDAPAASLDLLTQARTQINIPICAIGGITLNNAAQLLEAGVDMLAVISDVFGHEDVFSASESFKTLIEKHKV